MRPRRLPLLSGLLCLGALAQAPKVPQAPAAPIGSVPVTSYLLGLHRSATHPRTIILEITTPDTRALHVDQLRASGGAVAGSLDVQGSSQPADGRLARYEYRGETEDGRARLTVRLPDGTRLRIDRAVEASPAVLSLLVLPAAGVERTGPKATLRVSATGAGKAADLSLRAAVPAVLTWDDATPVSAP